jgi:chorismate dehydratase
MTIKVGRIPYLNSEVFYFDMMRRGIELYDLVPSALAPALAAGEIGAAPVPLVDCFRMGDGFQPVAGFCIATVEKSRSVLLHSRRPITDLTGARLGITSETSTSVRLLQVLLTLKYQVKPGSHAILPPNPTRTGDYGGQFDAFLVIGDAALRHRRGVRGYPYRYDLGEEWFQWTQLPFVFARWMVRQDVDPKDIALIEDTLYVGMEDGVDALYHISEPREELRMLPRDILEYIRGFRYFMGLSEYKGMDLFQQYLTQIGPSLSSSSEDGP